MPIHDNVPQIVPLGMNHLIIMNDVLVCPLRLQIEIH